MKPNPCHSKDRPAIGAQYPVQTGYNVVRVYGKQTGWKQDARIATYRQHTSPFDATLCVYGKGTNDVRCKAFPELGLPVCPHFTYKEKEA